MIFCLLTIITGCGPKEFNLSTQTPKKEFSEEVERDSIVIYVSDGTCEIEYAPVWVSAEVNDSVVFVTTKANGTGKARKDVLVVKCGASDISIDIEQGIKATHLDLPNYYPEAYLRLCQNEKFCAASLSIRIYEMHLPKRQRGNIFRCYLTCRGDKT